MDPPAPLERDGEPRRAPAAAAVVVGLLLLLALVAMGARRHVGAVSTESAAIHVDADAVLRPVLWTLGAVLAVLVVIVLWPGGRTMRLPARRRRPWWYPLVAVASVLLIAMVLGPVLESLDVAQTPPETVAPTSAEPPTTESAPPWRWVVLAAVVVLGVVAVAAGTRRRSQSALPAGVDDEGVTGVAELVPREWRELPPAGGNPRARVIRDYAEMERAFAGLRDVSRRPSETAREFVRPPAGRLMRLFEVARFSHARVDEAMAADADTALHSVVDELEHDQ
jgi:MFS family permease